MGSVTVGLDIGTTSIKAIAVDDDGRIVSRTRVPHRVLVPAPQQMEHDAEAAWRRGPRRAISALGDVDAKAIAVTAMVPSLAAVDERGRPLTPGLLYGDARGSSRHGSASDPTSSGEMVGFLDWTAGAAPDAHGYWPAQAVANRSLGGAPAVDWAVALTSAPLYGAQGWDERLCAECGAEPEQLPQVELPGAAVGRAGKDGPLLTAGTVDVWCEQLVAGADDDGDVLVICGTTLIVWAVVDGTRNSPGLWSVSHSKAGRQLVGGASNGGGLFLDWAGKLTGPVRSDEQLDPTNVPVWTPYPRGERTPYHDPTRRAALHDLDLTHGPAAVQRGAWEATGFVVRHHIDIAGARARRIVATGGGTRVGGWMSALADATGLPVHVAAEPEGAALGAAYLARVAAGLEADVTDSSRWARTGRVVEPDHRWAAGADSRYRRFLELSAAPGKDGAP
jgi:xylulokinase